MRMVFIGAGKMATAIAKGLVTNGVWPAADLAAVDPAAPARESFSRTTGVSCADAPDGLPGNAEVLLLAVKPQVAGQALPAWGADAGGKLVLSIMAGVTLARLRGWFPGARLVRIMPNTPMTVGRGAAVFACGPEVTRQDRTTVTRIFETLGVAFEMTEDKIDAVTALSGSGPAYVFEMVQALTDAGAALGLPPDQALALTVQTVLGAAEMLRQGLGSPDELRAAVTSPGGTTAAGLAVLQRAGFRQLVAEVLRAAHARAIELGR